jgi:hypothetical protein
MKTVLSAALLSFLAVHAHAQLLVSQSDPNVTMKVADVSNLQNVTYTDLFPFRVDAAARRFPGNTVYLASGDFTTQLYEWDGVNPPVATVQTQVAIQGLAYIRHGLFGFANFANPMGIYKIDPTTGACTLWIDTSAQGYRFFALDGDSASGMLYGYTEYGSQTGLYEINPVSRDMARLEAAPPGGYGMCRGLAVGNHTAYLVATHPTDTFYAYDLQQWFGGEYVPFANPYATSQNGGGAWVGPVPSSCYPECNGDGILNLADFGCYNNSWQFGYSYADCNLDGVWNLADFGCFQTSFALGCP